MSAPFRQGNPPAVMVSKRQRLDAAAPKAFTPGPVIAPGSLQRIGSQPAVMGGPIVAAPTPVISMPAPPTLPTTADYNLIGKKLESSWQPAAPGGEEMVTVRLDIDGSRMNPPQERSYQDDVLWNVREPLGQIDAFAKLTCEDEGLPPPFAEEIARAIRAVAEGGARVPPQGLASLELEVVRNGVLLQDTVLWDTRPGGAPPEQFAQQLCADLSLGAEFESGVAFAVREQLQTLQHTMLKSETEVLARGADEAPSVMRTEKEAIEQWTPVVRRDGDDADGRDVKGAARRDRYAARR